MRFAPARVFLASLLLVSSVAAQSDKVPKRPTLPSNGDTNDPAAYFSLGLAALDGDPHKAADAFYWASRLEPTWAEPLYARRIALLLQDPRRLMRYMGGDRKTLASKEIRQIDSLQYRAFMINPFLYRKLDRLLLNGYFKFAFEDEARRMGAPEVVDQAALEHFIARFLIGADPSWRAWGAYTSGDLPAAARLYGEAIKFHKERNRSGLYADRARVHYLLGQYDSAHADMKQAIEKLRKPEKNEIVFFYESKALYEHSIALILDRKKDLTGAREAYGRALQEDLSYHPAHVGAAMVALLSGDTASAVASMDLAVQVAPNEPGVRAAYATVLKHAGRLAEAETHLLKAIELEPLFAAPYFSLAQVHEAAGKGATALEQYRAFLEHAARNDARRTTAQQRVQALSTDTREPVGSR